VVKKLVEEGILPADAEHIAKFLIANLKRLNPTNVGVLIGDIDEFAGQIRREFIGQITFAGVPIDEGLRVLLKHFTLPGESQVVERIVETFGITYHGQNRQGGVLANSDAVYSLSYLLMMLQSNLHNPQVVDKMTLPQFAKLSKGMNGAPDA
jgi:brefeldin A-inhibited guanine nucleotide-exchange protein